MSATTTDADLDSFDDLPDLPSINAGGPPEPEALADEKQCAEIFDEIIAHFREWKRDRKKKGDHDRISESAMWKGLDVAAKYKRIQMELREPRIVREYKRELMAHERAMSNLGRRGAEH